MKLPENLLQYVQEEAARIHHGRIILELNATSDKVYVVTEVREQFKSAESKTA